MLSESFVMSLDDGDCDKEYLSVCRSDKKQKSSPPYPRRSRRLGWIPLTG